MSQYLNLDAVRADPDRLAVLRASGLLDSEVEEVFDRLSRLAVRLLRIPAAFISLVDEHRDFYKSACGFGEPLATVRELTGPTFCHYTIQQTTPLVIPDTAADPRYRDVPTVKTLGVAAYVGIPIVIEGHVFGAFCAIDVVPRAWTTDEVETLSELAASAQREMELRGAIAALERSNDQMQAQAVELELQTEELHATTAHLEERTEEAEAANRSKSEFLSMMSHELRTPLNAIGGYSELIALGVQGPVSDAQVDFLRRIQRAAKHLQTLIADILEFARVDAGKVHFNIQPVLVANVVREATELVGPQVSECGVSLVASECVDVVVYADRDRLRQIVVNLLNNAIKFTPPSGTVTVTCARVGDRTSFRVRDTGRGIPQHELRRIFEPFVQVDRSQTPAKHQGVGLGLSICRAFARGMGGDLIAESDGKAGSTFTLTLPAA